MTETRTGFDSGIRYEVEVADILRSNIPAIYLDM
jgi:hypothetical protein